MDKNNIQRQVTQIKGIRFDSTTQKEPQSPQPKAITRLKRHDLADISPTKHIKINTDRSLFPTEPTAKRSRKEVGTAPRQEYHEFMSLDQAGPTTIAYDAEYNLLAIKKIKVSPNDSSSNTQLFRGHRSVVGVLDLYRKGEEMHIICEYMDVTLQHVLATPRGDLACDEIAWICAEILNGLVYIHNELDLAHGDLGCEHLLLDRAGHVKIANMGERMFYSERATEDDKLKDVRSIGTVMMEIMEPETILLDPASTALKCPEKWKNAPVLLNFLKATENGSIVALKAHAFVTRKPRIGCLIPHVLMAQLSAQRDWKMLMP